MKELVYYLSVGHDKYHKMTVDAVRSLRDKGKYLGEVNVLTDNPGYYKDTDIVPIDIRELVAIRFGQTGLDSKRRIWVCKYMIHKLIDLESYSRVTYIDSDIFFINDFKLLQLNKPLMVQYNGPHYNVKSRHISQGGGGVLTDDDVLKYGDVSICAGLISLDSTMFKLIKEVDALLSLNEHPIDDQSGLIKVILNNYPRDFSYIPGADWHYAYGPKSVCIHAGPKFYELFNKFNI